MSGTPNTKRAQVAERRARAIALRAEGQSWDTIAEALGYKSRGAACTDVARALDARLKEQALAADQLREVELERLETMEREVWVVLRRRHVTVSGGKIVYDEPAAGEEPRPLVDDGPVLAAVDRLNRISERRAKLLGLDSPVKVEQGGQVRYEIVGVDLDKL
jgi:hypothetical protein